MDVCCESTATSAVEFSAMVMFSKVHKQFVGYFYPTKTLFVIINITNAQGDLTNVPNRTPTLVVSVLVLANVPVWSPGTM